MAQRKSRHAENDYYMPQLERSVETREFKANKADSRTSKYDGK